MTFISPCTPSRKGVGWEQRAFSMLLAYAQFADIDLWFAPTTDNPDIARAREAFSLCKKIRLLDPLYFKISSNYGDKINKAIFASEWVHVFRGLDFISEIQHDRLFWDIDEVPWSLRPVSRNQGLKVDPRDREARLSLFSAGWKKSAAVISSSQLERFDELGPCTVMPNVYTDIPPFREVRNNGNLLFVGNMGFRPNVDAVCFFSEMILPLLPDSLSLVVVGRKPIDPGLVAKLGYWAECSRIKFHYDVEDCSPFYREASAAIVPLRIGGGPKLKTLEAFAHSCPVISTTVGCEGLLVRDGVEASIKNTTADFAEACTAMVADPERARLMAKRAYQRVVSEYSQSRLNTRLHSLFVEKGLVT